MRFRVIDSNILFSIWHGKLPGVPKVRDRVSARKSARKYLQKHPRDCLVTPVRLEFYAGMQEHELPWTRRFLNEFRLLDDGVVMEVDWREAERLTKLIPTPFRIRGALDCLIRALCDRLNAELCTNDTGVRSG